MRPNRKWKNPRWWSVHFKCMYLRCQTRYQRKSKCFRDLAFQWDFREYSATKPEVVKSKMAASKLQMRVSPLSDKISTKLQRLRPCFWDPALQRDYKADTVWPSREWKKPRWQPLNFNYAYVLSGLLIKTLVIIKVSSPENNSNSLALAEHFVLSTSGLVAQYPHKSQWNAGLQKHRYSRWNSVDILSESADTCSWSLGVTILDFSTSGLIAQSSNESKWEARPRKHS